MLFYISLATIMVRYLVGQTTLEPPYSIIFQILMCTCVLFFCKKHDGFITSLLLENYYFQLFLLEFILAEVYFRKSALAAVIFVWVFVVCLYYSRESATPGYIQFFCFLIINLLFLYQKLRSGLLLNLFRSTNEDFFIFFNSDFYRQYCKETTVGWLYVWYLIYKRSIEKKVFKAVIAGKRVPLVVRNKIPAVAYQKLKLSFFETQKSTNPRARRPFLFSVRGPLDGLMRAARK